MHEREKSDPFIVAAKSANNSGPSGAESVERREGAEGNMSKNRTCRTQSRASVYSGLERVRERAKVAKKERFTALLHHVDVDVDLLRAAFSWLKRACIRKPENARARVVNSTAGCHRACR